MRKSASNSAMMSLVIGYGNPLRGDDAFGPRVVELLEPHCDGRMLRRVVRQSLVPELAAEMAEVQRVVFVDAAVSGRPGRLECRELAPAGIEFGAIPHTLEPAMLATLACVLYGARPRCAIVTARAETLQWRPNTLSPAVAALLPAAVKRVLQLVRNPDASRRVAN